MDTKKAMDILHDVVTEGFSAGDRVFSLDDEERAALEVAITALKNEISYMAIGIYGEKVKIMSDVIAERNRQDAKWGEQNHSAYVWATIIGEEYGETCKAINEFGFNPTPETEQDIYTEAIQTMASCMAMLECMERSRR